jgi:hypothetical protein
VVPDEHALLAAQFRDVHAAAQHSVYADRHMEKAGHVLLGSQQGAERI